MQILNFIGTHFDSIVALVGIIGGLLMGSGVIKDKRAQKVVKEAVAFAAQIEKLTGGKPSASMRATLKAAAMEYAQKRLPSMDIHQLSQSIEAAVNLYNAECKKK